MSELREECYECLNNQSCIPGADYGSIYCSMYREYKIPEHREYAHKFSIMKQQLEKKEKRIKELEEEKKKYIVQLTDEQYRNLVDVIKKEVKKEFEQKVKDVLQNNRNEIFSTTYLDEEQFKPYTMQIDRINKIEKELLEENSIDK